MSILNEYVCQSILPQKALTALVQADFEYTLLVRYLIHTFISEYSKAILHLAGAQQKYKQWIRKRIKNM